ncbi:DUF6507 family protein [Streptomyces erythrochromogenes]|uniref:DUF6507 family protein n=1 Tax=Streptomyces erythrochromogenes TaxID=285574 RepID=UPI00369D0C65
MDHLCGWATAPSTGVGSLEGSVVRNGGQRAGTMVLGGTELPKEGGFGPVAQALLAFQQRTENDLKFLPVRTGKSITGARLATEKYSKAPTEEELKGPEK